MRIIRCICLKAIRVFKMRFDPVLVAIIMVGLLGYAGYFGVKHLNKEPVTIETTKVEHVPVRDCFISNDGDYLICRLNAGE